MMPMNPTQGPPTMAAAAANGRGRLAAAGMGAGGDPSTDAGKVPPGDANYRQAPDPATSCAACAHFIDPDGCEVVAGRIAIDGVSDLFTPADAGAPAGQMPAGPPPAPAGPPTM